MNNSVEFKREFYETFFDVQLAFIFSHYIFDRNMRSILTEILSNPKQIYWKVEFQMFPVKPTKKKIISIYKISKIILDTANYFRKIQSEIDCKLTI